MAGGGRFRRALLLIPLLGIAILLATYLGRGVKSAAADEDDLTPSVPEAVWGGPGVEVTTTFWGARLKFDCASGTIENPIQPDWLGNFKVFGSYLTERDALGNAVRELHPAQYEGTVQGDFLRMTVFQADEGKVVGAFAATRGMRSSIHPCF